MTRVTAGALALALAAGWAGAAAAETWRMLSVSATTAFLIDMDSIVAGEDGTTFNVARVPRRDMEAGDLSHAVDQFVVRCQARQIRLAETADYGPDGAEEGRYPDSSDFEAVRRNSFDDTLRGVVCDAALPNGGSWPTIAGYVAAGRPE